MTSLPVRTPTPSVCWGRCRPSESIPQIPSQLQRRRRPSSRSAPAPDWSVFSSETPAPPAPDPRPRDGVWLYWPNGLVAESGMRGSGCGIPAPPLCCWWRASRAPGTEDGVKTRAWVEAAKSHLQSRTPGEESEAQGCCVGAAPVCCFPGSREQNNSLCSLFEGSCWENPCWASWGPPLLVSMGWRRIRLTGLLPDLQKENMANKHKVVLN